MKVLASIAEHHIFGLLHSVLIQHSVLKQIRLFTLVRLNFARVELGADLRGDSHNSAVTQRLLRNGAVNAATKHLVTLAILAIDSVLSLWSQWLPLSQPLPSHRLAHRDLLHWLHLEAFETPEADRGQQGHFDSVIANWKEACGEAAGEYFCFEHEVELLIDWTLLRVHDAVEVTTCLEKTDSGLVVEMLEDTKL